MLKNTQLCSIFKSKGFWHIYHTTFCFISVNDSTFLPQRENCPYQILTSPSTNFICSIIISFSAMQTKFYLLFKAVSSNTSLDLFNSLFHRDLLSCYQIFLYQVCHLNTKIYKFSVILKQSKNCLRINPAISLYLAKIPSNLKVFPFI